MSKAKWPCQKFREGKKKKRIEEGEKRIDLDKGKRQEGLIRETEPLPERDNEQATEDEIKERKRVREGLRGAGRRWTMNDRVWMEEK